MGVGGIYLSVCILPYRWLGENVSFLIAHVRAMDMKVSVVFILKRLISRTLFFKELFFSNSNTWFLKTMCLEEATDKLLTFVGVNWDEISF